MYFFTFLCYCAEFVDVKNGEKRLLATGQSEMILSDKVDLLHVEKVHLAQERDATEKGGCCATVVVLTNFTTI